MFFMVLYVFIMAYAIVAHRLLDIEIIIKRTLIFGGLLCFVYLSVTFVTFLLQSVWQVLIHFFLRCKKGHFLAQGLRPRKESKTPQGWPRAPGLPRFRAFFISPGKRRLVLFFPRL